MLVTDHDIENVDQLLPILEVTAREKRPLVIVCENIEGQALAAIIMNAIRGTLKVAAVKAPRYGEERRNVLKDLALSVGAKFISRDSGSGLHETKLTHLGSAKTIDILKNATTVVGGKGDVEEVEKRIEALKIELEQTDGLVECERIQDRITRLVSGIAIIHVGGATEVEMIEKRHRVEDALEAVRSAQEGGIVSGGGVALLRASENTELELDNGDQHAGFKIVLEAVKEPVKQMALNAGGSPDLILSAISSSPAGMGWNFATSELVEMVECGIIDPTRVTITALQNAVSAASTLITTNYAIVEND
jgi:chaperonin GroEL